MVNRVMEMVEGIPREIVEEIIEAWELVNTQTNSVEYPWTSIEFLNAWGIWKKYRSQKGKKPYKQIGEQGALKKLARLSDGIEERAIYLINYAIEQNWEGFWAVKVEDEKERVTDEYKQSIVNTLFSDK